MIELLCAIFLIVFGALPLLVMLSTTAPNGLPAAAPSSTYFLPGMLVLCLGCLTAIYTRHLLKHRGRDESR
jgi:hypothetical protein